ncbi:predicted protein [Naegleria gruberi]|uniref:Predicted protein n=1 Tax=Naegleria gruberi TaxID=5762 RepID=D2VBW6_NAEGR|nr:uncharacterized protein NAEGRDRAFT_32901 [Naegleria gruberi]EFC45549.1 predicted protein [Naegleria gruberi]|eukprot:XP_002678293.1 predicted protein [Naegleria gruberi strain NEG-M]
MRRFLKADSFLYNLIGKFTGVIEAIEYCGNTLDKIINERREAVKQRISGANDDEYSDILSLLVEANVLENLLTDGEVKSNSMIMVLAGHETTSTLMQWVSYEISKKPEIQDKLFKEVTEVLNGRDPTYEDVEKLHYVNAVLMETLRYRPPVSAIIRQANRNTTLGDYPIPKGTTINPMFQYLHKRPDIWTEPNSYMPERFVDPQFREESQHNLTFLAFSFGNRQCIGKKFSLLEACMILAKLIQNYKFRLLNDETVDPVVSHIRVVNRPSKNMKIEITRR